VASIEAFYTSPRFKVERTVLNYMAARHATDADAKSLAAGKAGTFSAWRVERQSLSQLLLADLTGRTRSWLMAAPASGPGEPPATLLYFGSAVVARASNGGHKPSTGWMFHAVLRFHRLDSRLLLSAASKRVGRA
jgi:hypothetical protein